MRIFLAGITAIALVFLMVQFFRLVGNYRKAQREYDLIIQKMGPIATENATLQASITALKDGQGAERELHNAGYAAQGEKMLIIIPKNPSQE